MSYGAKFYIFIDSPVDVCEDESVIALDMSAESLKCHK